jgi:AraC-like DNA-binding protein/mannose-6-phosphate isomerase-like protein (cupin superfamily)
MADRIRSRDERVGRWLEGLKPSTAIFCRAAVRAPWGFRIDRRESATFHIVTEGEAVLEVEGSSSPIRVEAGDLVLLPTGAGHALRDGPHSAAPALEAAVRAGAVDGKHVEFGGDGPRAVMVCGAYETGLPGVRPPPGLLPPSVRFRVDPALTRLVDEEASRAKSGSEAVLTQLLALLVTQALRAHLARRLDRDAGAALSRELAAVITYVNRHYGAPIALRDLSARASLSRSALSERFRAALGVSPMRYVRLTRLSKAAEMLRSSDAGLRRIARAVGYGSTSAFSRAFRAEYGVAPGAFRQSTGAD